MILNALLVIFFLSLETTVVDHLNSLQYIGSSVMSKVTESQVRGGLPHPTSNNIKQCLKKFPSEPLTPASLPIQWDIDSYTLVQYNHT